MRWPAARPPRRRPPPRRPRPKFRCRRCSPRPTPPRAQNDVKACQACHSFDKGGAAKVGPPLWGVVGRPVASVAGFAYSDALKAIGGDWTYEKLDHWITKPSAMAAGTKMAFPGEPEATKRADILAYLQKQSDNPVPFPQ